MAAFTRIEHFLEHLAHKVHNLGSDSLVMALVATEPNAATVEDIGDVTEIAYTNLSSRAITTSASAQTGGAYKLTLTDLTLTASGAVTTWRYGVIYNDTAAADQVLGYIDAGENITMADGHEFTFNFDGTDGLFDIDLAA